MADAAVMVRITPFPDGDYLMGESDREICEDAQRRIHREKGNFERLAESLPFGPDPLEKPAVTHNSFVLLRKAMEKLSHVPPFHSQANEVVHFCKEQLDLYPDKRTSAKVLAAINKLELLLEERCGPLQSSSGF
ncbi:hypothetical protein NG895_05355 [Aeoliella sp. ICT_H6.2]|uniref:Uncharacterized protein n=1 Tax=Aeoliella straminimaris TaxID=2954799 RepID=A0A9X2F833_9BACT|nr:hypothetical protein [Aeoliella straminimaris]